MPLRFLKRIVTKAEAVHKSIVDDLKNQLNGPAMKDYMVRKRARKEAHAGLKQIRKLMHTVSHTLTLHLQKPTFTTFLETLSHPKFSAHTLTLKICPGNMFQTQANQGPNEFHTPHDTPCCRSSYRQRK